MVYVTLIYNFFTLPLTHCSMQIRFTHANIQRQTSQEPITHLRVPCEEEETEPNLHKRLLPTMSPRKNSTFELQAKKKIRIFFFFFAYV